ncbi:MAG: hypothetical protein WAM07_00875 [Halobacillus sp.]|uniref:hypothetical protein n=1 Tax=Halobacillus sp. TaxID=56800 RepID=UPI003BB2132E
MRNNVKPIFPVTDELLELIDLLDRITEIDKDQFVPHTMNVLNKVYAQGIIAGYQKARVKNNHENNLRRGEKGERN